MTRTRGFKQLELTRQFEKSYAKLGPETQKQCDEAVAQLLEPVPRPGLHLKPILPSKQFWEARLSKGDRLILLPQGEVAVVIDVVKQ
jgi:mRNA-degrading endonuclease RelE of RelBE toxin-antitoxin system